MKKLIFIVLLSVTMFTAKAQSFNPLLASMLQDTLDTYVSMISSIKGMSASVYIPGQGLWLGVSGNSHESVPITEDMEFGIASNTKVFVATIMLMLQENGILSLDDPLHEWLPDYDNVDPDITIRQLLNHTSGISDPIFLAPWYDTIMLNLTRVFTPEEVLSWLGAPYFAPGTDWEYSNVNYILAGMIAQTATGFHISQLIRDSILTPLNLNETFYDTEEAETGVIAHRWFNTVDYNDTSRVALNTAAGCAGALFSTAADMALWYNALFNGQLLNPNSLNELTTFVDMGSPTQTYGLGLFEETTQGLTYWGHGGDTWGYKSKMLYDPCIGTVVCGLTNSFPSGVSAVAFLLYRVVYNHVPHCAEAMEGINVVCQGTNSVIFTIPPIDNATSYLWTLPNGASGVSDSNSITVDFSESATSGTIMVSGVNEFGPGGNASLWITVNPTPVTPIVTQELDVLSSSQALGNQWYNSDGMLDGEINQTYTYTFEDDYYTIVTLLGCSSEASNIIHAVLTKVSKPEISSTILLYPNPINNELVIEIEGNDKIVNFEILNSIGEIVFKDSFYEKTSVFTNSFAAGVYMVKLNYDDNIEFKKIIKD
jgi:D-alanyl-D-alanine carboxypeptidase